VGLLSHTVVTMNCPSPVHCPEGDGMNQNPNALAPALTTREDLNGMANLKVLRRLTDEEQVVEDVPDGDGDAPGHKAVVVGKGEVGEIQVTGPSGPGEEEPRRSIAKRLRDIVVTFGKFIGPGFMVRRLSQRSQPGLIVNTL
jgi:metal iron transporter